MTGVIGSDLNLVFSTGREALSDVLSSSMATAIPVEDIKMLTASPSDELPLSQNQNSRSSLPAEERDAGQEPENLDFTRGSSVGDLSMSGNKSDTFRDKQAKVFRSFPSLCSARCACFSPSSFAGRFTLSTVLCRLLDYHGSLAELFYLFISAQLGAPSSMFTVVPCYV